MRTWNIALGDHVHVYNRGALKQPIFFNDRDKKRLLFLILLFQSSELIKNVDRAFKEFVRSPEAYIKTEAGGLAARNVELVSFCFMPNHFHLLLREIKEGGIANYMQRVQNAYTKYINTKYDKSGHLFQGPYKAVRVGTNEQLLHLSAYIHKNAPDWKKNYYSSLQDCIKNRWGSLLNASILTEQFSGKEDDTYRNFVETSAAKEISL